MLRSQIVVLNVVYDEGDDEMDPVFKSRKACPAEWDWSELIDEPIRNAVEVIAAGPIKGYPRPGEEE